jgi:hypothetical protein
VGRRFESCRGRFGVVRKTRRKVPANTVVCARGGVRRARAASGRFRGSLKDLCVICGSLRVLRDPSDLARFGCLRLHSFCKFGHPAIPTLGHGRHGAFHGLSGGRGIERVDPDDPQLASERAAPGRPSRQPLLGPSRGDRADARRLSRGDRRGPWDFDENEPGPPLPRAGRTGTGPPEPMLGG